MVAIYYIQTRQVTEDSHERFVGHIVVACQQLEKILCDDSVRVLGASIVAPPTAEEPGSARHTAQQAAGQQEYPSPGAA